MNRAVETCPCCKRHVPIGGPPFVVGNPCQCCNRDPLADNLKTLTADAIAEFMRTVRVLCATNASDLPDLLNAHSDVRAALVALDKVTR